VKINNIITLNEEKGQKIKCLINKEITHFLPGEKVFKELKICLKRNGIR